MCRLVTGHKATALQEVRRPSCGRRGGGQAQHPHGEGPGGSQLPEGQGPSSRPPLQISQVCQLCQQSPRLFSNHAAQLHTLLVSSGRGSLGPGRPRVYLSSPRPQGLYCVSVNCMDNAEAQFTTALRVRKRGPRTGRRGSPRVPPAEAPGPGTQTPADGMAEGWRWGGSEHRAGWPESGVLALPLQLTSHQELWAFIVTNLASVYIREGHRHQEVLAALPGAGGLRGRPTCPRPQEAPPRWAGGGGPTRRY